MAEINHIAASTGNDLALDSLSSCSCTPRPPAGAAAHSPDAHKISIRPNV
jgi:hypothetical protein